MNTKLKLLSSALFSVALASSLSAVATEYDNAPTMDRNTSNAMSSSESPAENRANVIEHDAGDAMDDARQKRLDNIQTDDRDQSNRSTRPAGTGTINNGAGGATGTSNGTRPGTDMGNGAGTNSGTGTGMGTRPGPAGGGATGTSGATAP
ncbi:MAG: hypothetical protein V7693_14030 [Halopseudomonas sabulinigri]